MYFYVCFLKESQVFARQCKSFLGESKIIHLDFYLILHLSVLLVILKANSEEIPTMDASKLLFDNKTK